MAMLQRFSNLLYWPWRRNRQGAWVATTALARSNRLLAFSVIGSGPTVTLGERMLYSELSGADECKISGKTKED